MHPSNPKLTARSMAIGFSVLMSGAVILAIAGLFRVQGPSQVTTVGPQDNSQFRVATAEIYGRLRLLPELEKQMLANARSPVRANAYRRKRADARRRIDELLVTARSAAASDAQRKWLEQLTAMTARADARYERILALAAQQQHAMPLAVNTD